MSGPAASDPAGTVKLALPVLLRVTVCATIPPPESVTVPVATVVADPLPATATATVSACAVVMLDEDGVTVNVGVVIGGGFVPEPVTVMVSWS